MHYTEKIKCLFMIFLKNSEEQSTELNMQLEKVN